MSDRAERASVIVHRSIVETALNYPDAETGSAILRGFLGASFGLIDPSEIENPVAKALVAVTLPTVDAAAERYDKAVEAGKQSGRKPKWIEREEAEQLYAELGAWKRVAEALDCSEDTLERARAKWRVDDKAKSKAEAAPKADEAKQEKPPKQHQYTPEEIRYYSRIEDSPIQSAKPQAQEHDSNQQQPQHFPTMEEKAALIEKAFAGKHQESEP